MNKDCFNEIIESKKHTLKEYNDTSIGNHFSRIKSDFNDEIRTLKDYIGREVYELLQNADDAKAKTVTIELSTASRRLSIYNDGDEPFSADGFRSILRPNLSPKSGSQYIGQKGLGFRSLLNWAEQVDIYSNNVHCTFSEEIVCKEWNILKQGRDKPFIDELEKKATQAGRQCPLPILSLPDIEEFHEDVLYNGITAIRVIYRNDRVIQKDIVEQLTNLSEHILLFLKHVRTILIKQDNVPDKYFSIQVIEESDNMARYVINQKAWTVLKKHGSIDQGQKYELAVAVTNDLISNNYVYSFFPTKVMLNLPCLIHGTYELDSSRNQILDTPNNKKLLIETAVLLMDMAQLMAQRNDSKPDWYPFSLVNIRDTTMLSTVLNEFCKTIDGERGNLSIFPTVGGTYQKLYDTFFYSEQFSELINRFNEKNYNHEFHLLLSPGIPGGLNKSVKGYDFLKPKIELLALSIKELEDRGQLIDCLYSEYSLNGDYCILIDNNDEPISKTAFVNTGTFLNDLPKCRDFSYLNDHLARILNDKWGTDGRSIVEKLKRVYSCISYGDVNSVINSLLPNKNDRTLSTPEYLSLIHTLYGYYKEKGEFNIREDAQVFLRASNEELVPSTELTLCGFYDSIPSFGIDLNSIVPGGSKLMPLDYWQLPEDDDVATKINFFIELGVSTYIPRKREYFGTNEGYLNSLELAHKSYDDYKTERTNRQSANKGYKLDVSYIRNLDLNNIFTLLIKDTVAFKLLTGYETINWFYSSLKSTEVETSYTAYCMSTEPSLNLLKYYIVSEEYSLCGTIIDYPLLANRNITKQVVHQILMKLGAKEDAVDFSVKALYNNLLDLPVNNPEGKSIQRVYKIIREALHKKQIKPTDIPANLKLWAVTGKSHGKYLPCNEVYYWDNDQLPQKVLEKLPKLEIGRRIGEDSIKLLFNVKLAKDIQINIANDKSVINQEIEENFNRWMRTIMPYILSYRGRELSSESLKQEASSLKQYSARIYSKCMYAYEGIESSLSTGDLIIANDGTKNTFCICFHDCDLEHAKKNPAFCEAVAESLSILFKVTGDELKNIFRSIFKDELEQTAYLRKKDIPQDLWINVQKLTDITEKETHFWEAVLATMGKKPDMELLRADRTEYLKSITGVDFSERFQGNMPDVADMIPDDKDWLVRKLHIQPVLLGEDGLYTFYLNKLEDLRNSFSGSYEAYVYEKLSNDKTKQNTFCTICAAFKNNSWIKELAEQIKGKLHDHDDVYKLIVCNIERIFNWKVEITEVTSYKILGQYQKTLDEAGLTQANLNEKLCSLSFFPGNEIPFEEMVKQINPSYRSTDVETDIIDVTLTDASIKATKVDLAGSGGRHKNGFDSDKKKFHRGHSAEKMVLKKMLESTMYEKVIGKSRNLDSVAGNDSLHYDIEYYKKGSSVKRYLEVKSFDGSSIIMSAGEYKFGNTHADVYDLALVTGNCISIISCPFINNEDGSKKYAETTKDYRLFLELVEEL